MEDGTKLPHLDIVVVTWNQELLIHECLESIRNSDTTGFTSNVFVMVNQSNDGTLLASRRFVELHGLDWVVVDMPSNLGPKYALEQARKQTNGEYFVYVAGDDAVHPDRFRLQVQAFESLGPDVIMVGGTPVRFDQKVPTPVRVEGYFPDQTELRDLRSAFFGTPTQMPHTVTQMYRMAGLASIGGFPEDFPADQLPVWFLLALIPNAKVAMVPEAVTFYRISAGASSAYMMSRYLVYCFDRLMQIHGSNLTEREAETIWMRREHRAQLAIYEEALYCFGHSLPGSRWRLFRRSFATALPARLRLNCLRLSALPIPGRRICRRKYRMRDSPLLHW